MKEVFPLIQALEAVHHRAIIARGVGRDLGEAQDQVKLDKATVREPRKYSHLAGDGRLGVSDRIHGLEISGQLQTPGHLAVSAASSYLCMHSWAAGLAATCDRTRKLHSILISRESITSDTVIAISNRLDA